MTRSLRIFLPWQGRPRPIAMLLTMAVLLAATGCMAGYGRLAGNADAARSIVHEKTAEGVTYYLHGSPEKASALAAITSGYQMESHLWQSLSAERASKVLGKFGRSWEGYDILDADGVSVGYLLTAVQQVTVTVNPDNRTVSLALRFKVGGGR